MPLYEYHCPACAAEFEELTRSADADKQKCPKCGAKARRKFSTFGVAVAASPSPSAPPTCQGCPSGAGGSCPYSAGH